MVYLSIFLSFFPLLAYLCFIATVIFDNFVYINNFKSNFTNRYLKNINKSQTSLCPTNNIFLFGQEEIISHSNHFFNHFLQKNDFKITKQILPFLIFFCVNSCPSHKLKSNDLKCCPNSEYFSIEIIKITNDISSAEIRGDLGCFIFNQFCFKRKKCLKFYQFLVLLSGDISLNPGPSQYQ